MKLSERNETHSASDLQVFVFYCEQIHLLYSWLSPGDFYEKRMTSLSLQQYKMEILFGAKTSWLAICYCENIYVVLPHSPHSQNGRKSTIGCCLVWLVGLGFFCAPVHTYIRFAAKQTAESESFSTFCLRCWFLVSIIFTWQFRHNLLCFLSFSAFSKANALLLQSITTITFFALYSPTIVNYHFNTSPPLLIAAISASIHDCNPNTDFHWIISHFSHTTSFCKQQNQSNHSSVSTRLILNRLNLENLH